MEMKTLDSVLEWEAAKEISAQEDLSVDSHSKEQKKYLKKLLERTLVILVLDLVIVNQSNIVILNMIY